MEISLAAVGLGLQFLQLQAPEGSRERERPGSAASRRGEGLSRQASSAGTGSAGSSRQPSRQASVAELGAAQQGQPARLRQVRLGWCVFLLGRVRSKTEAKIILACGAGKGGLNEEGGGKEECTKRGAESLRWREGGAGGRCVLEGASASSRGPEGMGAGEVGPREMGGVEAGCESR